MTAGFSDYDDAALDHGSAAIDEQPGASDMCADDTGIRLAAPIAGPRRQPRGDVIHVGRFALPTAAFAWGLSLLVHGGVILAACLTARVYFRHAALPMPWGGGGGAGGGIVPGTDVTDAIQRRLPTPSLPDAPSHSGIRPAASEQPDEPAPDWDPKQTLASMESGEQLPASPIIGVGRIGNIGPAPVGRSRAGGAAEPRGAEQIESSSQGGSAGQATGPGLPGALASQGLPTPDYPLEARRHGQQGTVKVALEVQPDGTVGQVRITSDPGFPLLRQAALAAAQKLRTYRFIPARRFGRPVPDVLIIPYRFSLK